MGWTSCFREKRKHRVQSTNETMYNYACTLLGVSSQGTSVLVPPSQFAGFKISDLTFKSHIPQLAETQRLSCVIRFWQQRHVTFIWTASSASAQSRQNLRCSLIQAVNQEEPSDRKPDPWPLWMAGHAQLKFVMTECSKTQIRLTGLI